METELIEEIINDVHSRLVVPLGNRTLPRLIGMKDHIERITSWLKESSHTAHILTIWGMSGIGKTSLAKYVYELHHHKYTSSFVGEIRRRCAEKYHGVLNVQKQLCDDLSRKSSIQVHDVSVYTSVIENAFTRKKVLVVLDDVDSLDQLDALLGNKGFHSGSKIIITTTDASLIERCALFKTRVKPKHKKFTLEGLSNDASLELLCHHAFNCNSPNKGYKEVSIKLASYCEGHPLALEVLGKSLYNRDVGEWEDSIELLKREPHSHIKSVLQMSFDSLPFENDKELFKHIACFFVGTDRDLTETILNACNINTKSGMRNLIDKCFLSITMNKQDMILTMHSLIQDMGRDLVRQESFKKPWKRSRLWCHEESFKVLKQNKGKRNLLGLSLDMRMLGKEKSDESFELKTESLSKMDNLMLLQLNYVLLSGCFKNFPEELRWLCMHGFPLKYIPLDLPMESLVALDISYSNIESFDLSKDKRLLRSLKILNLSFCEQLHSLGGFSKLPALERFIVKRCKSLTEVCESLEQCVKLIHIDISYCYKLKKIPIAIGKLKNIETLLLDGCNSSESQIETIPCDLKLIAFSLPSSLITLSLAHNNLSNESFPRDFSCLYMLEELCLDNNPIVSMPDCVRTLPMLEMLSMKDCEMVVSIENPPRTLTILSLLHSTTFKNRNTSLRKIKFDPDMSPLYLFGIKELFDSSFEIDGIVKIQAMADVEENILHSLGWTNLEFIKERLLRTHIDPIGSIECQSQMYYEFGIFSTFYEGNEMPDWIGCRNDGFSISFTIPSSPKKLRGLNFCCVEAIQYRKHAHFEFPVIIITNVTNNYTWVYDHYIDNVTLREKGCLCFLSHWMFGPNEMDSGDQINILVGTRFTDDQIAKECGINLLFDEDGKDEEKEEEEKEEALGYYKSWNHIIGGDLSLFQLTTGEYILDNRQFMGCNNHPYYNKVPFIGYLAGYKEERVGFKAFSQKKSSPPSHVFIKEVE